MTSFIQVANDPVSTVYYDWEERDFRCLVLRGPMSICGYLGVKKDNPLYGRDYYDVDIECHGGLTFASEGKEGTPWPAGYWWFGWDYGHYNDASLYDTKNHITIGYGDTEWTPEMVKSEFPQIVMQFDEMRRFPK